MNCETEVRWMPTSTSAVPNSSFSPQQKQSSSRHDVSNSPAYMASFSSPSEPSGAQDSFLTRFILTPLRMISFLLSLALIDHRNRSYRVKQHSYFQSTLFGRMKQALSSPWQDPEPYSDLDAVAGKAGIEHTGDVWRKKKDEERWTMKKKHRKMIKMEIKDALEIRMRVVLGLVLLGVLSGVGGVLVITMLWRMWSGAKGIA